MTKTERTQLVEAVRKHILWIIDIYPNNRDRAINEAYGFVQGVIFGAGVQQDDELFKDLQAMWDEVKG